MKRPNPYIQIIRSVLSKYKSLSYVDMHFNDIRPSRTTRRLALPVYGFHPLLDHTDSLLRAKVVKDIEYKLKRAKLEYIEVYIRRSKSSSYFREKICITVKVL